MSVGRCLLAFAILASGCTDDTTFEWRIELDDAIRADTIAVELRVRAGGCGAGAADVYVEEVARGMEASRVASLAPGTYGFSAVARNDGCQILAEACVTSTLPRTVDDGAIVIRLVPLPDPRTTCTPPGCASRCSGDAGMPPDETCDGTDDDGDGFVDEGFDLASDPANCGACGRSCPATLPNATAACVDGSCVPERCDAGFDDCDRMPDNGCEVELAASALHCGRCGAACATGVRCAAGLCTDRIVSVDGGSGHACALVEGGRVLCWGDNASGQLGDGTFEDRPQPVLVRNLRNALQVDAGGAHTCVLLDGGAITCWGENGSVQLGIGFTGNPSEPRAFPDERTVTSSSVQVAAGGRHTCALDASGNVSCWGDSLFRQSGAGFGTVETPKRIDFTVAAEAEPIAQIDAGARLSCAVTQSGAVMCWGDIDGAGRGGSVATMTRIGSIDDAVSVAVGARHACALRESGDVACWGANDDGVFQLGAAAPGGRTPIAVAGVTGAIGLDASGDHACALRDGAPLLCWGRGDDGQLGAPAAPPGPVAVPPFGAPTAVVAGGAFSCALLDTDEVHCWGSAADGRLGTEGTGGETPVAISGLRGPVDLAAGQSHACARHAAGGVACWGAGDAGQLGDGGTDDVSAPVALAALDDVLALDGGTAFTCALRLDETVVCWGDNADGQLGDGSLTPSPTPVDTGLSDVRAIAAGRAHACALGWDGSVRCWGNNGHGQMGPDFVGARATRPVAVDDAAGALGIAAADQRFCALLPTGDVRCWGRTLTGSMGGTSLLAMQSILPAGERFVEVDVAHSHACLRSDTGDVYCLGRNLELQAEPALPMANTVFTADPVDSLGTSTGLRIGGHHSCAFVDDQLHCWGDNLDGQLGDGTTTRPGVPVVAMFPDPVRDAVSGFRFTCARNAVGEVRCVGEGARGQLGDGTAASSLVPVVVPRLAP